MTELRCPVCNEKLSGDGDYGLTTAVRRHFEQAHHLTGSDADNLRGGMGSNPTTEEIDQQSEGRGSVSSSTSYGDELTERGDDLYGVEGPPDHTMLEARQGRLQFRCPLCGFQVWGRSGRELTDAFRRHLIENGEMPAKAVSPQEMSEQ